MTKKQLIIPMLGMALLGGAATGAIGFAHAQSATTAAPTSITQKDFKDHGVAGTVVSVSGTTITLTGKDGKTYTIDASKAAVEKIQTIAASDVKAGDTLMVGGMVNGTSVTAVHIMDGKLPPQGFGGKDHGERPGVFGTVSAVSGSTLTVTGKNGTTYTVDATSAKVLKAAQGSKPVDSTLAAVVVGDTVAIHGTVTGTSVTATEIIDGVMGMKMGGRGLGAQNAVTK